MIFHRCICYNKQPTDLQGEILLLLRFSQELKAFWTQTQVHKNIIEWFGQFISGKDKVIFILSFIWMSKGFSNTKSKLEPSAWKAFIENLMVLMQQRNNLSELTEKPKTLSKRKAAISKYYIIMSWKSYLKNPSRLRVAHVFWMSGPSLQQWLMGLLWSYLMYCVITCINTICQLQSA